MSEGPFVFSRSASRVLPWAHTSSSRPSHQTWTSLVSLSLVLFSYSFTYCHKGHIPLASFSFCCCLSFLLSLFGAFSGLGCKISWWDTGWGDWHLERKQSPWPWSHRRHRNIFLALHAFPDSIFLSNNSLEKGVLEFIQGSNSSHQEDQRASFLLYLYVYFSVHGFLNAIAPSVEVRGQTVRVCSLLWLPETKLWLSGVATSPFMNWAILLALLFFSG